MRPIFLIAITALVAACASPGELLEREPQLSFDTKKPADVYAACLSEAWSRITGNVSFIPVASGYRVILPHPSAGADVVAEIRRTETGAKVRYVERMPSMTGAWIQDAVVGCK